MKKLKIYKGLSTVLLVAMLMPTGCSSVKVVEIENEPDTKMNEITKEIKASGSLIVSSVRINDAINIISDQKFVSKLVYNDKYLMPKLEIIKNNYEGDFNLFLLEENEYAIVYELISVKSSESIFISLGKENLNITKSVPPNEGYDLSSKSYFYDSINDSESWVFLNESKKKNTFSETYTKHKTFEENGTIVNHEINAITIMKVNPFSDYKYIDIYSVKNIYNDKNIEYIYYIDYEAAHIEINKREYNNLIFLINKNKKFGIDRLIESVDEFFENIINKKVKSL